MQRKKKGVQILEVQIAASPLGVPPEAQVRLGQWYVSNNQGEKAVTLLRSLADTEFSSDASERDKEMVGRAALLVGQELTYGVKSKKTRSNKKKKKEKKKSGIPADHERAHHYITKADSLGVESARFCLARLLLKQGKKEEAREQFNQFIAGVDVDACRGSDEGGVTDAFCQAQVSLMCFELPEGDHGKIGPRIGEIFRVCQHSNKLSSLYQSTNTVPNVFERRTHQIMKKGTVEPAALDLCYLFGRLCCEAEKGEASGLRCLQYAADNGHAYAQWFLGVAAIDKLIARGSGPAALRVQQAERYLVGALCSETIQDPKAREMLQTVVGEYVKGGSMRILLARAACADRDGTLEKYLACLPLKVNQGNMFDTLDLSFVQELQPPEIETVLAKVKRLAQQKESPGACILAGRLLVAESARDKTDPGEFDLETLQNGVRLLEKAQKISPGDMAASFYLGRALHKMATVYLRKQQPEGYTYLMRAIRECDDQRTKTSAALLLFAEQDQQLKEMLKPVARMHKTSVDDMALQWAQEGWRERKDIDGVITCHLLDA